MKSVFVFNFYRDLGIISFKIQADKVTFIVTDPHSIEKPAPFCLSLLFKEGPESLFMTCGLIVYESLVGIKKETQWQHYKFEKSLH